MRAGAGRRHAAVRAAVTQRSGFERIFQGRAALSGPAESPWLPFPDALRAQLLAAAAAGAGREVCGFIGGRRGLPLSVYPVRNCAARPDQRFAMAPQELIRVWQRIARRGEDLLAVYHSHVSAAAYPSPTDLAEHVYRDLLCVVVAPAAPAARARVRAFLIGERVIEVGLRGDTAL